MLSTITMCARHSCENSASRIQLTRVAVHGIKKPTSGSALHLGGSTTRVQSFRSCWLRDGIRPSKIGWTAMSGASIQAVIAPVITSQNLWPRRSARRSHFRSLRGSLPPQEQSPDQVEIHSVSTEGNVSEWSPSYLSLSPQQRTSGSDLVR